MHEVFKPETEADTKELTQETDVLNPEIEALQILTWIRFKTRLGVRMPGGSLKTKAMSLVCSFFSLQSL